ncbi:MAG TPA: hypothetical protein VM124_03010 [Candidatus Limnocylindrales bacterium]|nr:hypothetical protein [Candidatus Limnocylindrales bacterium]
MVRLKYTIFKVLSIVLVANAMVVALALTNPQPVSANAKCMDERTEIPNSAVVGGREYDFCKAFGGYSGGNPGVCNDGTHISDGDRAGGREVGFCSDKLGYMGAAPGVEPEMGKIAPNEQPKYVNNDCNTQDLNQSNCGIIKYLVLFIKFLSAIVGVVIVASIIIGGITYSASKDDPGATAAAKKRIANAILALGLYVFMFALLQYLIPGGVL